MKQGNRISGAVMAFGVAAFGAGILVALNHGRAVRVR